MLKYVRKRDGSLAKFSIAEIEQMFTYAFSNLDKKCPKKDELVSQATGIIDSKFPREIPSVEDVADIIEDVLLSNGYSDVMNAFAIYRDYKRKLRDVKKNLPGERDKAKLSINSVRILESRYLLKDNVGKLVESPTELFKRVAKSISEPESKYGKTKKEVNLIAKNYFELMWKIAKEQ